MECEIKLNNLPTLQYNTMILIDGKICKRFGGLQITKYHQQGNKQ